MSNIYQLSTSMQLIFNIMSQTIPSKMWTFHFKFKLFICETYFVSQLIFETNMQFVRHIYLVQSTDAIKFEVSWVSDYFRFSYFMWQSSNCFYEWAQKLAFQITWEIISIDIFENIQVQSPNMYAMNYGKRATSIIKPFARMIRQWYHKTTLRSCGFFMIPLWIVQHKPEVT